jgi:peptidyl-prolyl cis-trans isomerase-like protein 2
MFVSNGRCAVRFTDCRAGNVSVYSSGNTGASLTSTSVDIQTMSSKLLWDEEEIMFEAISNPPKNKGKEKDVGKRRAYVRVVTSLGGASLNLELYCEKVEVLRSYIRLFSHGRTQAPKTCYNFLQLAKQGKYNDVIFHRLVPGFMVSRLTVLLSLATLIACSDSDR